MKKLRYYENMVLTDIEKNGVARGAYCCEHRHKTLKAAKQCWNEMLNDETFLADLRDMQKTLADFEIYEIFLDPDISLLPIVKKSKHRVYWSFVCDCFVQEKENN